MDAIMNDVKVQRIALLNDAFRKSGFEVVLTCGVQSVHDLQGLLKAVREFNSFDENNDPYGERDFGRINWFGDKVFWKIDYHNRSLDAWEDPLSPNCQSNTHPNPRTLARKTDSGRITRKGVRCPKEKHLVNLLVTLSFKWLRNI